MELSHFEFMKSNRTTLLFLVIIIFGALILRLVQLGAVPPGLNRDEAALGFTAYSLLKTGRDEYGKFFPLSLQSFGYWKLPAYAYVSIPFVAIFGLNEWAIRLPSVLAGVVTIAITFAIASKLFNRKIGLLVALLMAISPWHVFFSRVASEANLAVFWVSLAWLVLVLVSQRSPLVILFGLFLSLSILTYHGNHIFTPLIFLVFCFTYRKKLLAKPWGYISLLLFGLIAGITYSRTLFSADQTKISGLLSINDPSVVHNSIEKNRLIANNSLISKLTANKYIFLAEHFGQNYLQAFSPEFLFVSGGGNLQHNIPDFGNLYLFEAPFLLLGLFSIFYFKHKSRWILLLWLLLAPIGASLTKDAPHSARQFAVFPVLPLIIGYGLYTTSEFLRRQYRLFFWSFIGLAFIINFILFYERYFVLFPYKAYAAWGDSYKEMVYKLQQQRIHFNQVFVTRPDFSPNIYYLFYTKPNPLRVQKELVHYPDTSEGFSHVRYFDGITYEKNNWTRELMVPGRLYVDWAESVPSGATQSAIIITKTELAELKRANIDTSGLAIGSVVTSRLVDTVDAPDGSLLFYLIATYNGTPSAEFTP